MLRMLPLLFACALGAMAQSRTLVQVRLAAGLTEQKLDGRLLLMFSNNDEAEPRFQIGDDQSTQQIFGIDVDGWQPDQPALFQADTFGYPVPSLAQVPEGDYFVQALLHRYETFKLASGHTVKLPMDDGEGQRWNVSPGNIFGKPVKLHFDPKAEKPLELIIDQVIPPIEPPADTPWVKHIRIESPRLSKFWGRPMYLGAHVLLPAGFEDHPEARYPLVIMHGHFPQDMEGFRPEPPDADAHVSPQGRRASIKTRQAEAHAFYKQWSGPDFPRVLLVMIQHANPYYDDSYAVNSANLGPYGDAITYDLVPAIERQFRGIGAGWARFLYGGSTGGWESLAVQIFYPREYNGCWAACPDPVDFRQYTLIDLYNDENAYFDEGPWKKVARPGSRNWLGHVSSTVEDQNLRELVLGTKSRSGDQWDIWEAVFSPQGEDGYPRRIWDKRTGKIDREVAAYWREHYDLRHILERDWATLGPDLVGKIHVYTGDMDTYYLNNAVYLLEAFLKNTTNPFYNGQIDYGDRAEHCWNGDHQNPTAISSLRYHSMFIPKILNRILASAPNGADLTSWRY